MKHYALSAAIRMQCFTDMEKRLQAEKAKNSTGYIGKKWEIITRDTILVKGLSSVNDFRARKMEKTDITVKIAGKLQKIEVKTGGAVNYDAPAAWTEQDIFPGADYVVFSLNAIYDCTLDDILDENYVFTRKEFIQFLEDAISAPNPRKGKTRLESALSLKSSGALNIQLSAPARARGLDWIAENGTTLRTFMEENGLEWE